MTRNQEVAQTILSQLGGRQFLAMTGAKHLIAIEEGLSFQLPKLANRVKGVRVILDPSDTYTVSFHSSSGMTLREFPLTYCDQLRGLFEDVTGLKTSLFGTVRHEDSMFTSAPAEAR